MSSKMAYGFILLTQIAMIAGRGIRCPGRRKGPAGVAAAARKYQSAAGGHGAGL